MPKNTAAALFDLDDPALEEVEGLPASKVEFARFLPANTTVRYPANELTINRFMALVSLAQSKEHTLARFPDAASFYKHVASIFTTLESAPDGQDTPKEVDVKVVSKVILAAQSLGLITKLKPVRESDLWLAVHPAGEALLSDPDTVGMLAMLLLSQPCGKDLVHRPFLGVLNAFITCHDEGIAHLRVEQFAFFFAGQAKESGWKSQVKELSKFLKRSGDDPSITLEMWAQVATNFDESRAGIEEAVDLLMGERCTTEDQVSASVLALHSKLLPGARVGRLVKFAQQVAPSVIAGDAPAVREAAFENLLAKKVESHLDLVRTALGYLASVGLLVELAQKSRGRGGTQFSLTEFGHEAVNSLPVSPATTFDAQKKVQTSLVEHSFANRGTHRSERFLEKMAFDRTEPGRAKLCEELHWSHYEGQHLAGTYEWVAVRSFFSLMTPRAGCDLFDGVRTRLNHSFDALNHAQGRGADATFISASNLIFLIEVTGLKGESQAYRELVPVVRHLRQTAQGASGGEVAGVFISPASDVDFVSYLLVAAQGDVKDGIPPVLVVPLSEAQVRGLLAAGVLIDDLMDTAVELVRLAAVHPSRAAARHLLTSIDELVAWHCYGAAGATSTFAV